MNISTTPKIRVDCVIRCIKRYVFLWRQNLCPALNIDGMNTFKFIMLYEINSNR